VVFDGLLPELRPAAIELLRVAQRAGLRPQVTSVRRSSQQQAALYARYLRGESDLPAAPPGTSQHEFGMAFDLVCGGNFRSPAQAQLGALWRSWGGRWEPSDPVHFFVRLT
jgi:LAS superfamily LD-carboxypeptidase LdcB